jgi:bifunctional UDP-N-acetylglucosamine pyrophosphorylase / glucosamine-1-phosphate N-acetyltransferase
MFKNIQAVILAAGQSKRFKLSTNKLCTPLCGRPVVLHITAMLKSLGIEASVIVGHHKEELINLIREHHGDTLSFFTQDQQLGTGHALACSRSGWTQKNILALNGDMPLLSASLIENLSAEHERTNAVISIIAAHFAETKHGYGRVITEHGITQIIEAKDFTRDPEKYCAINAGIYLINKDFLEHNIDKLAQNNAQKEFYITDLVGIASEQHLPVTVVHAPFDEVRGINTIEELFEAEQVKNNQLVRQWMKEGVRFLKPVSVSIDVMATIGAGTCIGTGAHLLGTTTIGKNCTIQAFTRLENATIGDQCCIHSHCIISDSVLQNNVTVEPFVYIHDGTVIEHNTAIGSFADIQNTTINRAYLDAQEHGDCCDCGCEQADHSSHEQSVP